MSKKLSSILLTNDDGVADLLGPTTRIVTQIAKRITIIVPNCNRTGCSAGISRNQVIEVRRGGCIDKNEYWTASGLPNDCVRYAMRELCPEAEVVVSGINDGWNLGYSVINSGTIGAAMEGIRFGCSGVALSAPFGFRAADADEHWMECVQNLLERLLVMDVLEKCGPVVINVNLPNAFAGDHAAVLDVSKAEYQATRSNAEDSIGSRVEEVKQLIEVEELQTLNRGLAVINVISTPWTVDARSIRVSLERSGQ